MPTELPKNYVPSDFEPAVYEQWIRDNAFAADPEDTRKPFCMVIPPPNVTAALHLGHALNNTLQDVIIRWRRMMGRATLWMPGTDHAGIATQTVVEKRLLAEEGKKRTEYERDEFVGRVQEWKDEYEARILGQLQQMGCSCDWDRTRFTMDDTCAKAVRETFFRMFQDGLIYRGKRLVNWDPATQTVLADDEVEHEDVQGSFWYLKYPLVEAVDGMTHITVATTRPETMLGDTAIAMNPSDPRAEALVGKMVRLPIVGREIPIIADLHVVLPDPESEDEKAKFSTGFLKVTPAHDPDDYQIGQRHDLPMINVMAPDGSISNTHGWEDCDTPEAQNLLGMDRFEARDAIVEFFKQEDLLEDVRPYAHSVGHSYRSHVPIEPYLSDQWYIAVKKQIAHLPDEGLIEGTDVPVNSLAGLALTPLLDGRLKFTPERYAKNYQTWLENLRDWPISRQLWWGHQIPVWSGEFDLPDNIAPEPTDRGPDAQVCAALDAAIGGTWGEALEGLGEYQLVTEPHPEDEGKIRAYVCPSNDAAGMVEVLETAGFTRDPDVLDTWFSSGLWPFSTLGWPDKTPELEKFYPGNVLSTAREIITLWVSRMVMMGQYCVGDIPFTEVFIHAMIQDGEGRKMSKSLGNGVDPADIIDSHGSDAMRYTLVSMTTQTQDVRMPLAEMKLPDGRTVNSSPKFDVGRSLCNKLWNAGRFAMGNLQGASLMPDLSASESLADAWFLSRLNTTISQANDCLHNYRFNELAETLYHFFWDDFCDWYLEIAKIRKGVGATAQILSHGLDTVLRLLHPIMPFITETLWAKLNETLGISSSGGLIRAEWPRTNGRAINPKAEAKFDILRDWVRQIRNVRMQHNVPPSQKVAVLAEATEGDGAVVLAGNCELLVALSNLEDVEIRTTSSAPPEGAATISGAGVTFYLLDMVDTAAELARLEKEKATLEKGIGGIRGKLGNENFTARAPKEVVDRERERLDEMLAKLDAVNQSIEALA